MYVSMGNYLFIKAIFEKQRLSVRHAGFDC